MGLLFSKIKTIVTSGECLSTITRCITMWISTIFPNRQFLNTKHWCWHYRQKYIGRVSRGLIFFHWPGHMMSWQQHRSRWLLAGDSPGISPLCEHCLADSAVKNQVSEAATCISWPLAVTALGLEHLVQLCFICSIKMAVRFGIVRLTLTSLWHKELDSCRAMRQKAVMDTSPSLPPTSPCVCPDTMQLSHNADLIWNQGDPYIHSCHNCILFQLHGRSRPNSEFGESENWRRYRRLCYRSAPDCWP